MRLSPLSFGKLTRGAVLKGLCDEKEVQRQHGEDVLTRIRCLKEWEANPLSSPCSDNLRDGGRRQVANTGQLRAAKPLMKGITYKFADLIIRWCCEHVHFGICPRRDINAS